ncbi:hypothetical protein Mal15_32540 [Stieleria maiorica]|uniref:Uncharacterized protein n=1 Tax=Stieleria maiorica TaxID=2795974 RepID=A0A5B9MEF5_9BACT|nr:hypothetical protein [Stieleria maiorica]QEF99193.1 hypothetical protein Mal15_32540 [Stieleria maiorica]
MPRSAFLLLALLTVPLIVGCEGCTPAAPTDPDAAEGEKAPEEAYSTKPPIVFPSDQSESIGTVKPGHWMTAEQSIRSNKADTRGELTSRSEVILRDVNMEKTGTIRSLDSIRPVVLPKGQMRGFDFRFRCPIPNSIEIRRINLASQLVPRSGGVLDTGGQPFNVMRGSEYFFVVLSQRPERFTRLQTANWTRSFESEIQDPTGHGNYRVVVPDASDLLPLPETMLDLTSTAVVFWDDLSEDALTPQQQTALADWIRFGGRLIVNGPAASESIANTSLADVLPLVPTSNIELSPDAAAELLTRNSVATDRSLEKQVELIRSESSHIAIDGRLNPDATAVIDTASLVLSRRIGRGIVVQPRFDLTDNWVEAWDSYDSFVNSVILNRPPREYVAPDHGDVSQQELAEQGYNANDLRLFFQGTSLRSDAAVNTGFRIATRDSLLARSDDEAQKSNSPFDRFSRVDAVTGISAWNDTSDANKMLQEQLTREAGIEIPGSSLVIRSLAIYLIVLVPLNYLVFRLMNRLEYAWFAVPLIAVIGAIFAARQARLDIGFARSTTELSILEGHAGYPRAHLTRMIGIYNSLSSRYELQFRTVDGIAAPLDAEPDPNTSIEPVIRTSFEEGPSLADFAVNSNRMRYVHAEQMVDLGGVIQFDGDRTLTSDADVEFMDAFLIRKNDDGQTEVAVVGTLVRDQTKTVEFRKSDRVTIADDLPMHSDDLIARLARSEVIPNGTSRLVARIDGSLPGMEISPTASQQSAQTIVIMHLHHADLREPVADKNLVSDFRRVNRSDSTDSDSTDSTTPQTETTAQ